MFLPRHFEEMHWTGLIVVVLAVRNGGWMAVG
ncbi:hypothetical protein BH23GEM4_BH23GEM4_05680 [soil metagenome]|jgi:hypothetical protein